MKHMVKLDDSAEQSAYLLTQESIRPQKALPHHICVWEDEGGQIPIGRIEYAAKEISVLEEVQKTHLY